ncbi:MAG: DUF1684 domain-containing protein [Thermoanaerobaculia bacterium]
MRRWHLLARHRLSALVGCLLVVACGQGWSERRAGLSEAELEAHLAEVAAWREQRDARLRRPDGWLSLAGLFWLSEGDNSVGSMPTSDLVFPAEKAPLELGVLQRQGEAVTFRPAPGAGVTADGKPVTAETPLVPDTAGSPTTLERGSLAFYAVVRGERVGIRLKDRASPLLAEFEGMEYFTVDPEWRLVARFEPYDPPKTLKVPNFIGIVEELPSPGAAILTVDGQEYRLEPTQEGDELFFVFGDATNGGETYGGGRFLYTDLPGPDGTVILDFNRAYNPPCVFTPYATCPLPTAENKLPIPIRAGERAYEGGYAH